MQCLSLYFKTWPQLIIPSRSCPIHSIKKSTTAKPPSAPLPNQCRTSCCFHGEGHWLAYPKKLSGPWWSGVSPRWHSHSAAERTQDTGGWRKKDRGMRMWSQQPLRPGWGRGKPVNPADSELTNSGPPWDSTQRIQIWPDRWRHQITAELIVLEAKRFYQDQCELLSVSRVKISCFDLMLS